MPEAAVRQSLANDLVFGLGPRSAGFSATAESCRRGSLAVAGPIQARYLVPAEARRTVGDTGTPGLVPARPRQGTDR